MDDQQDYVEQVTVDLLGLEARMAEGVNVKVNALREQLATECTSEVLKRLCELVMARPLRIKLGAAVQSIRDGALMGSAGTDNAAGEDIPRTGEIDRGEASPSDSKSGSEGCATGQATPSAFVGVARPADQNNGGRENTVDDEDRDSPDALDDPKHVGLTIAICISLFVAATAQIKPSTVLGMGWAL